MSNLPVTFATLPQGNESLGLLDQQFAAVGALVHIPCTAAGQNAITLTPAANTPAIAAYTDLAPIFMWVQPQTTTGAVTIGLTGLGLRNGYRSNGQLALGAGDLVAGSAYTAFSLSSLNAGAGGFVVDAFQSVSAISGQFLSLSQIAGSQTITIPATATRAYVRMWGCSGGSGSSDGTAGSGGSGTGAYLEKYLTGMSAGNTLVWTAGTPGAAGVAGAGGNGTSSTLASGTQTIATLTCPGGGGSAAAAASTPSAGGSGATVSTGGDINFTGLNGAAGIVAAGGPFLSFMFARGTPGTVANGNGNGGFAAGMLLGWYT